MAYPFRVRYGDAEHLVVDIGPGTSELGIEKAIAGCVGLPVGTFFIKNAAGVTSTFHAGLVGDWDVVLLPGQPGAGAAAAGGPAAAGGGRRGGEVAWTSDRLRTSLVQAGIRVDEEIMKRFISSSALQSMLSFCSEVGDVALIWDAVCAEPQSETRAILLRAEGLCIDGDILVPHRTTALFKWAFEGAAPCVLKIPQGRDAARDECRIYQELGSAATAAGVCLVPVRIVNLSGFHRVRTDRTPLYDSILMPSYPLTFASMPPAVVLSHGVRLFRLVATAVEFLSSNGWVHCDVKPSNIFISGDGQPWLGDFGSSVRVSELHLFRGGTPSFQIDRVALDAYFDLASLVVSFVANLGLIDAGSRGPEPWPLATIRACIDRIEGRDGGAELKAVLLSALDTVAAKM